MVWAVYVAGVMKKSMHAEENRRVSRVLCCFSRAMPWNIELLNVCMFVMSLFWSMISCNCMYPSEAVCRGFIDAKRSLIPSCMVVSNEASGTVRGPEDSTMMVERLMQFVMKLLAVVMASSGYALGVVRGWCHLRLFLIVRCAKLLICV